MTVSSGNKESNCFWGKQYVFLLVFLGVDLENIVYYKDDTHYFVMTAKKRSLMEKGVILHVSHQSQALCVCVCLCLIVCVCPCLCVLVTIIGSHYIPCSIYNGCMPVKAF